MDLEAEIQVPSYLQQEKIKLLPPNGTGPVSQVEEAAAALVAKNAESDATDGKKPGAVRYRECQKNHAAGIGGHALDGCGEFIASKSSPESFKCSACGCHRNFHRREVEGEPPSTPCESCQHRLKRKGPSQGNSLLGTASPRPLVALSNDGKDLVTSAHGYQMVPSVIKKRFRTKFTNEQKEKMYHFADRLGWKIQKHDEVEVQQFCQEVGIKRHVLKVWMHNNKNTFGKKIA